MPTTIFLVRAVVAENLRDKFDHWYSTDHLPWAIEVFKCQKAWRFWSAVEPGVHYAVYKFADKAACDAAMKSDGLKELIADFDKNWPQGVTRTRDIVTLAEERGVICRVACLLPSPLEGEGAERTLVSEAGEGYSTAVRL